MKNIEILFEDDVILVVNKPAGITVIPERFNTENKSIQAQLETKHGKLFVVHRLDRDTSGVLCFAKNEVAHKNISLQFENRTTQKFYTAFVKGRMEGKAGEIDAPILENPSKLGTMKIHPKGKEALTLFEVQEQFKHVALLWVEIKTGRTHQIRVHFASAEHPLLVDPVYAKKDNFLLSSIKKKYKQTNEEERPIISRLTLHASKLILTHPISNQLMTFEADMPHDLHALLKVLRKYDSI